MQEGRGTSVQGFHHMPHQRFAVFEVLDVLRRGGEVAAYLVRHAGFRHQLLHQAAEIGNRAPPGTRSAPPAPDRGRCRPTSRCEMISFSRASVLSMWFLLKRRRFQLLDLLLRQAEQGASAGQGS